MPKSRVRKKPADVYKAPQTTTSLKKRKPSPTWFGILVLGCMIVGVAWLVTYYVSGGSLPISKFGAFNVLVGFLWIALGFALSTQWH